MFITTFRWSQPPFSSKQTYLKRKAEVIDKSILLYRASKSKPKKQEVDPEKPVKVFFKLPYVGKACDDYAFRLKKLITISFAQVDFAVAFQTPMSLGKMFPFKDNIKNVEDRSMVVYNIKCVACNAQYIGKTKRILS